MVGMQFSKHPLLKWLPAVLMMTAIFIFSATPSKDAPHNVLRYIFNKGGHVIGYAMLTLSFLRAVEFNKKHSWFAWLLALLYAVSDEYHQSFVPGRHPAAFDVLVFDHAGALIAVWVAHHFPNQKQPVQGGLVVEPEAVSS
jgi:VanZ family protein